jgi:hypothetical protein
MKKGQYQMNNRNGRTSALSQTGRIGSTLSALMIGACAAETQPFEHDPAAVGAASLLADPRQGDLLSRPAGSLSELQLQLQLELERVPGGTQINQNEISYDDGRFVVTFALPGQTFGVPNCPAEWFCFYDGRDFSYPRGKLRDLGWQDLARWRWQDRTQSVHNNTWQNVDFINHYDYGDPANGHRYDYKLWAVPGKTALSRVSHENMADHVDHRPW